jgi:very-long-chain (3R)-3-hydroxyacyl-CoA dehydratase
MFYPLYPLGIGAEWWLLYRAIAPGGKRSPVIPPIFYFCLMLYIPGTHQYFRCDGSAAHHNLGSYTMYTYMTKQRRKTLGKAGKSKGGE